MTIAHDAQTRFPATNGTTGVNSVDTTTGNRTFTHTPVGTPKGVVVTVNSTGTTATITGVLYGGAQMVLVASATDTSEAGRVDIYVLTEIDIPPGAQTVTLQGATATGKWCTVSTVTAATEQTKVNATGVKNTTTSANPTIDISTTADTISYAALHSGAAAPATAVGAGCTLQHSNDYGALCANSLRRTSQDASGTISLAATIGSDDHCIAGVALQEWTPPDGPRIHSSSPPAKTATDGTTAALATDSFTPPDGALILVRWAGNSAAGVAPSAPSITDSLGTPLAYTLLDWQSRADSPTRDGQAAQWWAVVATGAAMTITVTNGASSGNRDAALSVTVLTHYDTSTPIGAHGKAGSSSAASIAQTYTAQVDNSLGFLGVCDWSDLGAMTAGTGCTLVNGGTGGAFGISYGFVRRSTPDGVAGVNNSLNVTLPGTVTHLAWVWAEVRPESVGEVVDLTHAVLVLAAQVLDPEPGPVEIGLTHATLVLQARALDPDPGAVSINLTPATLVLAAQALQPTPSIALTPAGLVLAAQPLDPEPGAVSVGLAPATLGLVAQVLDSDPGPIQMTLTPAGLILQAQPLDVEPGATQVVLNPAGLGLQAQPLDPDPGSVAFGLTPATLTLQAQPLDPDAGGVPADVDLQPTVLVLAAQPLVSEPGAVQLDLTPATLALAAQPLSAASGMASIDLTPVTLLLQAQPLGLPAPAPEDLMSRLFTIVQAVSECVRDRLANTSAGLPGRVCLVVPGQIAWDDCSCGQLAATISRFHWSQSFPSQVPNPPPNGRCDAPWLVAEITISILRCIPTWSGGEPAEPPSCGQLLEAARIWDEDAEAVRYGVGCCLNAIKGDRTQGPVEFALNSQTSVGPQGGCVGSELSLTVGVGSRLCC